MRVSLSLLLLGLVAVGEAKNNYPALKPCPGENRGSPDGVYGDHMCHHSRTHRVCAKLVDASNDQCTALSWNKDGKTFWEITEQSSWKDRLCGGRNPGDSWCICMWATADLIEEVGCDNVHINCEATDIPYVLRSKKDGGWNLRKTRNCLRKKCPKPSK